MHCILSSDKSCVACPTHSSSPNLVPHQPLHRYNSQISQNRPKTTSPNPTSNKPIEQDGACQRIRSHLPRESSARYADSVPDWAGYAHCEPTKQPFANPLPEETQLTSVISPDIQAVGDQSLLDKYGLKANDAILAEPKHIPIYEDLLNNYDAKLIAGGAAQNTARGAQYMLPPNSVVYLGGVGDDKYAAILHDAVKAAGLRVEYRVDPKQPTGRCGVVITGHDRSMCTDLGAANHYDTEHLKKPEIWKLVENAEVYYIGGYHFTVCPDAIMELAKEAAAKDKIFVLSLSAPFIPQFFKEPLDASSPYWDIVIGNETEAAEFAKSHDIATEDLKEIAKAMANLPKVNGKRKRVAIVTQGTDPTLVATQGEDEVKEYPVPKIGQELINDTNGAGDAFAGGLVAGLVQGKTLDECVDMGQWLAKLSIQELGPS
jgi:adenosine kinase